MRILAKIGGAQLDIPEKRAAVCASIASARAAGHELVVVHGGGNQIRELSKKLGLEERLHRGLRVTDAATADVVLMVLAGLVNKELVRDLCVRGVRAVGFSGADGDCFAARKLEPDGVDIGFVGEIARVETALPNALLRDGFTPVIATSAPLERAERGARERFYNINADLAAGPLAAALECDALLFLTDVPGVLDARKERLAALDADRCAALQASGVIAGGMIPKVEAALAARARLPSSARVKIAPADAPDCVLVALASDVGTTFVERV